MNVMRSYSEMDSGLFEQLGQAGARETEKKNSRRKQLDGIWGKLEQKYKIKPREQLPLIERTEIEEWKPTSEFKTD